MFQDLLLCLGTVCCSVGSFFLVEAILWVMWLVDARARWIGLGDILQKLRKMRAALSLSLSKVVGQKASEPSLLLSLFTGAPSLSTRFQALSKPTLPPPLTRDHQLLCCPVMSWA